MPEGALATVVPCGGFDGREVIILALAAVCLFLNLLLSWLVALLSDILSLLFAIPWRSLRAWII